MKLQVLCSWSTPVISVLCTLQPPPPPPYERHIIDTEPLLLTAANGTAIPLHGTIEDIQLQFTGRKYKWAFRRAQVSQPLLGGDCLAQHNLLIDIARRRLVSADTFNSI